LSDLEQRAAYLITVTYAHSVVTQSFDREVLAELSVYKVCPAELALPITIGFDLIDKDGSLFTSMPSKITLTVSLQIQPAYATPAMY
jgi:hypothetical protein